MKHLLKMLDLTGEDINEILNLADQPGMSKSITLSIAAWRARPSA